ncbi:MAG: biotin transporter BioY [Alphaproteobacteria bacterium]|nr:biotin transporter BioY [Alphaproteobacteria bacterium]
MTPFPSLLDTALPTDDRMRRILRDVGIAIAGSLLLTLSAKTQIPFWPVPMTMQTFVVMVIGMALGPRLGTATVALYLAQGAIGLPVFAGTPEKGIGLAYMMGPTGGYLAGFLAGAWLCGVLAERGWDRSWLKSGIAAGLGHAAIFCLGVLWLQGLIGWEKAFQFGVAPFWAATLLKTALAVAVLPPAWALVRKIRS